VSPVPELSAVEEQVVLRLAQGGSHRAIADELGVSLSTVEWHLARARAKLARAATLHEHVRRSGTASGSEEE
jgi:DNA-binding CsgD family transcriptional regulator